MNDTSITDSGASEAGLKDYLAGFGLALVLTAIPFGLVIYGNLPRWIILGGLFLAGIVQAIVHLHYFLRLDSSSSQRWNLMALLFTAVIIFLLAGGTIRILYALHLNMLPS